MAGGIKQELSRRFRAARAGQLRAHIAACPRAGETLRILDIGGRIEYWQQVGLDFLAAQHAEVTLVNVDDGAFSLSEVATPAGFTLAVGDGRNLPFADDSFDLCHSNSVIEHVGLWRDMQAFAGETRRVARSYFVQTPSFWFPIDPHFAAFPMIHWLPRPVRAGLMRKLSLATSGRAEDVGKAYEFVDSARLLTYGQMRYLFPEAVLRSERVLGLAKSFIAAHIGPQHLDTNRG